MSTTSSADPHEEPTPARAFLGGPSRWRRELIIYGVLILFGLLGMPFVIWYGSARVLGPYTHGQNPPAGPLVLLGDFLTGLMHGSAVYWLVALGPALLVLLLRLFVVLWRSLP